MNPLNNEHFTTIVHRLVLLDCYLYKKKDKTFDRLVFVFEQHISDDVLFHLIFHLLPIMTIKSLWHTTRAKKHISIETLMAHEIQDSIKE